MIIKVNYTVSDIYMSTSVSAVYIKVVYSGVSAGGGGTWGTITGTLSAQTDLQSALDAKFDDPTGTTAQYLRGDGTLATFPTIPSGTVTSVGLSMPTAFGVANSPITSSGTLAVTALGSASQYIRGDGVLATLPTGGSGGSSVSYYLNGGTAASVGTYFQMSTNAVVGTNVDFTRTGNGLISQFLTDVGDPNRLQIPAGNWNFEMFFSMSSIGGTPEFYVELLKYDGTTFTSIASSSAIPEVISGGTIIDLYLTSLAIPATILLATDRLALRVYIVNNSGGRTATLHTQDSHLCQIITNFAGGVSALNGLTANTQYFATGTSGTDFGISSVSDTHTFNLPTASATNRGALSSADWTTFNNKVPTSRTLTINGTTQDLTADRTFTIATANIYNADGTLTGNRTVTANGNSLTFLGGIETNANEQTGLILQTSATNKTVLELSLVNTFTTTGKTWRLRSLSTGAFDIATGVTRSFYIGSDGNVVIKGSSTISGAEFSVSGSIATSGGLQVQGGLGGSLTGAGFELEYSGGSAYVTAYNRTVGAWLPIIIRGSQIDFFTAGSNRARLTAAGRLLLGTTSESTNILEVNGTARIVSSDALAPVLRLTHSVATNIPSLLIEPSVTGGVSALLRINNASGGGRAFVNFGDLFVVTSNGRTAIGASTLIGGESLYVNGDTRINGTFNGVTSIDATNNGLTNIFSAIYSSATNGAAINISNVNAGGSGLTTNALIRVDQRASNGRMYLHNNGTDPNIFTSSGSLLIGTATEDITSLLTISSTTKGFLPPRMTTIQKNAIVTPSAGLVIYDTTLNKLCVYTTAWEVITSL